MLFVAFVLAGNRTLWTEGKSKQPKLTGLTFHYKQTNKHYRFIIKIYLYKESQFLNQI